MTVDEALARIAAKDGEIHAFVVVDAERARAAVPPPGPLRGVPVAVKDVIDVAGLPTRAGCRAWAALDALLAPPAPTTAPAGLDSTGDPSYVTPWTLLGGPIAALPAGVDETGLPLGVLLCARPGEDLACLGLALDLEDVLPSMPSLRSM